MNKKDLSERDICTKFITPALTASGWDVLSQIREQVYFTKGRIIVRGKLVTRGKAKFADYVLYFKPNIPIAIIEGKHNRLLERYVELVEARAVRNAYVLADINLTREVVYAA